MPTIRINEDTREKLDQLLINPSMYPTKRFRTSMNTIIQKLISCHQELIRLKDTEQKVLRHHNKNKTS